MLTHKLGSIFYFDFLRKLSRQGKYRIVSGSFSSHNNESGATFPQILSLRISPKKFRIRTLFRQTPDFKFSCRAPADGQLMFRRGLEMR